MSKSGKKKNGSGFLRKLFLSVILFAILGGGYYYLKIYAEDAPVIVDSSMNKVQYTAVENNDSTKYLAIIIYDENVTINTIAETFYKSDIFWPYIYLENKQVINNPLNIDADIVLRIPKISDRLLNLQDTASVNHVKMIADSILNTVTVPI